MFLFGRRLKGNDLEAHYDDDEIIARRPKLVSE
jgi:hypothetical protein